MKLVVFESCGQAEQTRRGSVDAAGRMTRITTNPEARAEINPLLQRLGVRIGLNFGSAVKGTKRMVQRLLPHDRGCVLPAPTGAAEKDPLRSKMPVVAWRRATTRNPHLREPSR